MGFAHAHRHFNFGHPLAHGYQKTQEQMKHSHLKNYKAVARATTSRVLGGGAGLARGWWLQVQRGARHAEP